MTFDSRHISFLRHYSKKFITTTNGNTTPVIGERSLTLTDTLNLDSVLIVPSLNYNILYFSQINVTLHCIVIFFCMNFVFSRISKQDRRLVMILSE